LAFARQLANAPQLLGGTWLNGSPVSLSARKGKVTMVEFWTLDCINCKRNLPIYNRLQARFATRGLAIVGVHTPETKFERSLLRIKAEIKRERIQYPILVDNDGRNWNTWNVTAWPTVFLVNKKGQVCFKYEGELNWEDYPGEAKLAAEIQELLSD